jgi:ssDNA-binding Zn-finger/Zn-ribbon topoisomerase 1
LAFSRVNVRGNEAGLGKEHEANSSRETVCKVPKCRKHNTKYLSSRFTNIHVDGGKRTRCLLCTKILTADSMNRNKLEAS